MNPRVLLTGLALTLPLLIVLLVGLGRNPNVVASPLVGRAAPPFSLATAGARESTVSLAGLQGKPVVMNFWATYCVPCIEEHGILAAAAQSLGSRVQFLGIVYQDDPDTVERFLRRHGGAYPSLLDPDGRMAIAYGVYGVPETFFVDGRGTIVSKVIGPVTAASLEENLQKALGGKP